MNASARSSIAKVMSPPSPAPAWALPAWPPRWGATCSRIAAASSSATRWGACPRAISAPLTAARRALAQLHVQVLGLAVADYLDGHGVARLVAGDDLREVVLGDDLVPVDRDDHVTAGVDLLPLEPDLLVGAAQARVVRGPPWDHLGDQGARVRRQVQPIRELRIERLGGDADVCVLDAAVGAKLVERLRREADRDREADPLIAARRRVDLLVDPDHVSVRVQHRPAGVARVDRGVGLDRALDLEPGQRLDRSIGGGDHPDRQRLVLPERAADRRDRLSNLDGLVGGEPQRAEVEAVRIDRE